MTTGILRPREWCRSPAFRLWFLKHGSMEEAPTNLDSYSEVHERSKVYVINPFWHRYLQRGQGKGDFV